MNPYKRPEMETNPAKKPGQIVNPIPDAITEHNLKEWKKWEEGRKDLASYLLEQRKKKFEKTVDKLP